MPSTTSINPDHQSMASMAFPIKSTAHSRPQAAAEHVWQPPRHALRLGESVALSKVQQPLNSRPSVTRTPLTKQEILSQYSMCFKGIGHFPREPYKFHLNPEHGSTWHVPRKMQVHLDEAFKQEINSLVELGILEPVTDHTDWVNSDVIIEEDVQMDSSNSHSPNHSIKRKLRIYLDPRDLNEALEREPYHTCSVDEITKVAWNDSFHHSRLQERILNGGTSSRLQETYMNGTPLWQIPMDKAAHDIVVAQDIF